MAKQAAAKKEKEVKAAEVKPTPAELQLIVAGKQKELRTAQYELFKSTHVPVDQEKQKLLRKAAKKSKYETENGLTIHKLRQAGHKVLVSHTRYVLKKTKKPARMADQPDQQMLVPCPSSLRKFTDFYPRGGQTYVHITTIDDETIITDSTCHFEDSFDYKLGIKHCLDSISMDAATELLAPLEIFEAIESQTAVMDA